MLANVGRFTIVSGIGTVYTVVGKLFISLLSGLIVYLILTNVEPYKSKLFSPLLPTIFAIALAYLVGILFMSIYGKTFYF